MQNEYDDEVISTFLEAQGQLFPEPVAETAEEAEAFLEDCFACVCADKNEVLEYLADSMDTSGMTEEEILDSPEVFQIPDGRFLVVEG